MVIRNLALAASAAALVVSLGASAAQAWSARTNLLAFSHAVALPGVTLAAGTYAFEVLSPSGAYDVVKVSDVKGRSHFLGFTRSVERPRSLGRAAAVRFGERPAGTPPPIDVWYPEGSGRGHQFIYAD
jgi:hypothetical protein